MAASGRVTTRRKIRVLYVLDAFEDPQAGTELQFWTLLKNLDRTQFEPAIVLLRPSEYLESLSNVPVDVLRITRLRSFGAMWRIIRAAIRARRAGCDVVHLFFNDVSLVFPPVLWLLRIPVVVSRRDLGFWYEPGQLPLLRFNARLVSAVVANCEAVRRAVVATERFMSEKVVVIYNALARQPAPQLQETDLRSQLFLPPTARLIVIVANLRPLKRIADAVRALAQVT